MMSSFHQIFFEGNVLRRGFWLYVWEIMTPDSHCAYYVGRTGDKASGVCQSPFDRFSKHLGANLNNNALRRHMGKHNLLPESCSFRFHTFGPLLTDNELSHDEKCDVIAALEKSLADSMAKAGYDVLNRVHCQMPLNNKLWEQAREQFARAFPKLTTLWQDALGRES